MHCLFFFFLGGGAFLSSLKNMTEKCVVDQPDGAWWSVYVRECLCDRVCLCVCTHTCASVYVQVCVCLCVYSGSWWGSELKERGVSTFPWLIWEGDLLWEQQWVETVTPCLCQIGSDHKSHSSSCSQVHYFPSPYGGYSYNATFNMNANIDLIMLYWNRMGWFLACSLKK